MFKAEHGAVAARLVASLGDFDRAEEALQDAFMLALQRWPDAGIPDRPGAWLTTVARNRGLDRLRRERVFADKAASIVAGERGPELAELAVSSIQSVTKGVIGVALIQSVLAGLGMLAVGVPGAGLLALLILILAVMQLPTLLVLIPVILYVFATSSTTVAVLFAIWAVLVGASDNVLKPLLMGHGSSVPMLVLFMGSLGGFIASGILGLFVGAVILSLGYTIFMAWLDDAPSPS